MINQQTLSIIYIHGAWHWSGCWYKLTSSNLLKSIKFHAFDNPVNGFNKEKVCQNFDEYTSDIQKLLESSNDNHKFILVAHSMGGSIASFIANKFPKKVIKIIYIAAFMCGENQSTLNYIMDKDYQNFMQSNEIDNMIMPVDEGKLFRLNLDNKNKLIKLFYNESSPVDYQIAINNLSEVNSGIPFSHVHNYSKEFDNIKRVYVECTEDNAIPIFTQKKMLDNLPGATIYTLKADHSPFFSKDKDLSQIIKTEIENC